MVSKRVFYLLSGLLAYSPDAFANQAPVFGGPIGATDLNNALLPSKAGVYLGLTELLGVGDRRLDNSGDAHPAAASAWVTALYVMYKYPFTVFGGGLASGVQGAYEVPGYVVTAGLGKPYQTVVGWRNLYADLVNWSRYVGPIFGEKEPAQIPGQFVPYGLTVKAEYSMIFPTGRYCSCQVLSPGTGTTFFIPNAAVTYLTPPNRFGGPFEADLHFFYDAQSRNPTNDYSNGAVIDIDYALAQHFSGFTLGVTGGYATQVQNDSMGPAGHRQRAQPDGDHIEEFTIGPVVSFPIRQLGATFKFKVTTPIEARNLLPITNAVVNLTFPLP